ncbi:hypothetical protein Tco_1134351 [Tanacetum coccineum]
MENIIIQDKYVAEILKKFDFTLGKTASTPMETNKALIKDEEAEDVDVHLYRSMIGSLMYLTASRPDIMFAVYACASDYEELVLDSKSQPQEVVNFWQEHFFHGQLGGVLRVGDIMKGLPLTASASEAEQDSGSGPRCQDTILGDVDAQTRFETTSKHPNDPPHLSQKLTTYRKWERHNMATMELMTHCTKLSALVKTVNDVSQIQALIDKKKLIITKKSIRSDLYLEDAGASEEVGEDSDHPTDSNQIPIIDQPSTSSQPKQKQKSKRKQRKEAEVAHDETKQSMRKVLDLEKAKSDQAIEIASLKKRVDKLEKRRKFRTTGLKRLKKFGAARKIESSNDNLDDDEVFVDVTTVEKEEQSTKTGEAVTTAGVEDSAAPTIPTTVEVVTTAGVEDSALPIIPTTVEETLAQTLMEIKAAKPKAKGITKEKGIIQEPERPLTKKDQVALDEDLARNIQAQLDAKIIEEERIERQKQEEANIALIESWENTQAMIEADRLLAERLQTREREELTDEEKGKLFMELMEKRRKHFAALRAQEKRNRPPTKATK